MARPFLTARWQDLVLITYAIEPAFVQPFLPAGCVPDVIDGAARCSLVAFEFLSAKVRGVRWPYHADFPEVNLRFYVKCDGLRGVSFLREFVPRRAIALVARLIYNEPYAAIPMHRHRIQEAGHIKVEHNLQVHGQWQRISVTAEGPAMVPELDPDADWIKEHRWGFGQTRSGRPLAYEVVHPAWAIYSGVTLSLKFDFAHVYGPEWAFLNEETPISTILAAGSDVEVWPRMVDETPRRESRIPDVSATYVAASDLHRQRNFLPLPLRGRLGGGGERESAIDCR